MDQIRFDFLNGSAITGLSRNAPTPSDPSDAFSQVLDQQLKTADDSAQQNPEAPRPRESRRRTADNADRPDPKSQRTAARQRDDAKTAAATTAAKSKAVQKPASVTSKSADDKTETAEGANAGKGKPKESTDGDKKDAAAAHQASSDTATATAKTDDKPAANADSNGQQQQQQSDGEKDPSSTAKPDPDAADAALAGLILPLPLQTISTTINPKGNALIGGGGTAPALQAALLVAANLNAGSLNIAGTANTQAQGSGTGGFKFGTILPDPTPGQAKTGIDMTAGATPGTDGSDPSADAPDPSKTIPTMPAPKPQANSSAGTSAKAKSTATASSPVAAAYAGQNGATTTQPVAPSIVQPWTAASVVAGGSEDAPAGPGVSADAELSGWPPYLDTDAAGAAAPGVSARTAAFLAQLKQNVQVPPAHEQVAIQIQKAMQNGSNRLTVNLEPAELGRVEVKLDVDKDKNVTASVIVDRPATLDLLQRDAKTLERALQDAGLQTNDGSLSFSLRNGTGQDGAGGNGANRQAGAGVRGGNAGVQASDAANQPARASVIATADGYVDLET